MEKHFGGKIKNSVLAVLHSRCLFDIQVADPKEGVVVSELELTVSWG